MHPSFSLFIIPSASPSGGPTACRPDVKCTWETIIVGFQSHIAQWDGEGRPRLRGWAIPTISMVRVKSSQVQEDTVALEVYMDCFLGRDWTWPV